MQFADAFRDSLLNKMRPIQYIPGLDGLRALAVIAVVWHHTHPGFPQVPLTDKGFLGVDVFFVLSGFLITTLLMKEKADKGFISLKNFYIRRSLRIFPLYYAVLLVLTIYFLVVSSSTQREFFLPELPFHATYTSNWIRVESLMAVTWSLSTEEQFYFVWPPLLVFLGSRALPLLLAFFILNQLINFSCLDGALANWGFPYEDFPILQTTFTPIVLGVFLAFALRSSHFLRFLRMAVGAKGLVVALVAILALANVEGDLRGWPRLLFQLAAAWMLAGVVLNPGHLFVKLLEWRPLAYMGTLSYGVYLLHKLVLDVVSRTAVNLGSDHPEVLFLLCLVGTLGVASLSHAFFEKPLLRLKDVFR